MPRPLRIQYPGAYYHILNRGNKRLPIVLSDSDNAIFLGVLREAREKFDIRILSYCLMHNHYHMLIQTPKANLENAMQFIGGVYTQRFNKANKADGHVFRGRYKSILIEEEDYLRNAIRYIHLNPVKAGVVRDPADWRYSSHKYYAGDRVDTQLHLDLSEASGLFSESIDTYNEFIQSGIDEATEQFYSQDKLKPFFGSDEKMEALKEKLGLLPEDIECEYEHRKEILVPRILDNTSMAFGTSFSEIREARKGHYNFARCMAMALLKEKAGLTHEEIARLLRQASRQSVKTSIFRFNQQMQADRAIGDLYGSLKNACSHVTT